MGIPQATFAQERRVRTVCRERERGVVPAAKSVPLVCALTGRVDLAALEDAVNAFVARHPSLRHQFSCRDGEVTLFERPPFRIIGERDPSAQSLRRRLDRPFDVTGWPLLRWGVVTADPLLLYLCADHLVFDGWSAILAQTEIEALYRARVAGRPPALPPPGDPFGFSARERRCFAPGPRLDAQLAAFHRLLGGRGVAPPLPLHGGQWDRSTGRYARRELLDLAGTEALERRCRTMRATIFMGVLAAFGMALRHRGAGPEIGLAVAVHNREEPETWSGVGWYANTLPLYFAPDGEDFGATVVAARRALLDLLSHHDLPLACVEERRPGSVAGHRQAPGGGFLSFADRRAGPAGAPDPDRWTGIDTAPAFRSGYGMWITLDDAGLTAVTASPADGGRVLAEFESALADALHVAASG